MKARNVSDITRARRLNVWVEPLARRSFVLLFLVNGFIRGIRRRFAALAMQQRENGTL
jgi:hypothetical protein